MARKPRIYDDDDGHTIANMNVEGMPWYAPENPSLGEKDAPERPTTPLTREESLFFTWGALKAVRGEVAPLKYTGVPVWPGFGDIDL